MCNKRAYTLYICTLYIYAYTALYRQMHIYTHIIHIYTHNTHKHTQTHTHIQGLQQVTLACQALTGAAFVAASTAIGLLMALLSSAVGGAMPLIVSGVPVLVTALLAVALGVAASKLWCFR